MENSKIEWTDHTFNPVVGCAKVSEACKNCYAESWAKRTGQSGLWSGERRQTSEANWRKPVKWNREAPAGVRPKVFCASLADVFEDHPAWEEPRIRLGALIQQTPNLDWLILTKRAENLPRMLWWRGFEPWPNVWLGTTVENQERADERIPHLLSVPAAVRFLSCEPLLGPIDLRRVGKTGRGYDLDALLGWRTSYGTYKARNESECSIDVRSWETGERVDWVIVGGESGPGARPMYIDWARSLRDQCQEAGVSFHFKQWGQWRDDDDGLGPVPIGKKRAGRELDGRTWDEFPIVGNERKGDEG